MFPPGACPLEHPIANVSYYFVTSNISARKSPRLVSERRAAFKRSTALMQPSLLPEAVVPAPRFGRVWEQSRADALLYGINLARKELSHPALFLFAFMLPLVSSCFILAKAILLTREIFWAALFFFFWLSSLNETSNCQCRLFSIPQCFLATLSMVSASIGNEVI